MRVIGLTGSIGMGKTTIALMLRRLGIPVDAADMAVHRLLSPRGAAFAEVAAAFPEALRDGRIDRLRLGALVFADEARLKHLETILHPLVARERARFLARCRRQRRPLAILDIPLLFETGRERDMDAVITVSAPAFLQRLRVLGRPGMNEEKFHAILSRQMPDAFKRRRSDAVIFTGRGKAATIRQLQAVLKRLNSSHARNRPRYRNHRR
jgi:dephospho-CoA kinase